MRGLESFKISEHYLDSNLDLPRSPHRKKIENPQNLSLKWFGGFLPKSSLNHNLLGSIAGARRDTVLSAAALATSDGTESRNLAVNCTVVAS
jgi:hypothetical protein